MTVAVQTTYGRTLTKALAGQPADEHRFTADTLQVNKAAGIGFGLVVSYNGTNNRDVGLGGTDPIGISVRSTTLRPSDEDTYQDNADIVVLTKGDIWVTTEDNVAAGDLVEYNITTGQLGSDGGTELLGARWMTTALAGAIALVRLGPRSARGEGAPANTVAPALSGTPTSTNVLTTSNGTWTGTPTSYTYQWQKDGVNIGGQTTNAYTILVGDISHALRCRVTAHNAGGVRTANSNAITPAS
jgi:hypothetical protein